MPYKDPVKARESARLRAITYRLRHPGINGENSRRYRLAHPEKAKAANLAWRKTHLEQHKAMKRSWNKANVERCRGYDRKRNRIHPEKNRAKVRAWQKAHPEKFKAQISKRRTRKQGNGGSHTAEQWIALKESCGNQCLCCHRSEAELVSLGMVLAADHVRAIADGGTDDILNIQPLCHGIGGCNNRKYVKNIDYRGGERI